jgi:hypothetical protein
VKSFFTKPLFNRVFNRDLLRRVYLVSLVRLTFKRVVGELLHVLMSVSHDSQVICTRLRLPHQTVVNVVVIITAKNILSPHW